VFSENAEYIGKVYLLMTRRKKRRLISDVGSMVKRQKQPLRNFRRQNKSGRTACRAVTAIGNFPPFRASHMTNEMRSKLNKKM
jgi:hypothetical protein